MRSTRIYFSSDLTVGNTAILDKTASHHLIRVLRMKAGAKITVFNGGMYEYDCELLDENQKATAIRVDNVRDCDTESPLHIHLLQGISRSDHMDLSIQKATELGLSKITPVTCERTNISLSAERAQKKHDHWHQIIVSACEQCGRSQLTKLGSTQTLDSALKKSQSGLKLVLDPCANITINELEASDNITLLIGPEGGLTESEIMFARENNFIGVRMGPRILRTETAAIVSVAALQILWGDMS